MKYRKPDDETKLRRISLRVSTRLYRELDDKRHALGSDWQTIGMRLWQEWLRSSADPADNFYTHHRGEHELLDFVLDEGSKRQTDGITSNLEAFRDQIFLKAPKTPEDRERILAESRE